MESQQPVIVSENRQLSPEESTVELVNLFDKMKAIKAFVLDIDGVLTDNMMMVTVKTYNKQQNIYYSAKNIWINLSC